MAKVKIWLLMLSATFLAYATSLKYGFSQDDWYFLYISTANNLQEVLNFFNPWNQSGFAFYRPLGTQLYYFLARSIAGLSGAPLLMHTLMLIIQSLSAYNVYKLITKLTNNKTTALLGGVLYASSSVHFLSLFYIAATQQLLAAFFSLLAINSFLEKRGFASGAYFALALLSKEIAIVTPIIMLLAQQRVENGSKPKISKTIKDLTPVTVVGLLYVLMRLFGGVEVQSEYHLVLNGSVISTMRWYYLFGYGAPEVLVNYGLPRMWVNFYRFMRDFGWQAVVTSVIPVTAAIYVLVRSVKGMMRKSQLSRLNISIYFTWWIIALAPVLFLQDHRYPHYLDLAFIPLVLLILENQSRKLQLVLGALLITTSLVSINLSQQSHWTTKRAEMSTRALSAIAERHACDYDNWLISGEGNNPRELSYALSLENGPKVICGNKLSVYYQGMDKMAPSGSFIMTTSGIVEP